MGPNVVLLVVDAGRRDAFEPYGAPAGATPAVAQLASRGVAHEAVFATACWTVPSHASMFTGLLPRAAGLVRAPEGRPHGCRPVLEAQRERLLPQVLRTAGYATGAVSTNLWLSETSGFALGFDDFVSIDSGRQGQLHGGGLRQRLRWGLEAVRARVDDGAEEAERAIGGWLERGQRKPFFWFVNLVECHSPYLPPRPYAGLGPLGRLRAAEEARHHLTLDAIWRACAGGFDIPDAAVERMRVLYRESVRYLDRWIGRLLESLDTAGVLEDTLVIVTADHGENLGDNGLIAHALSLDNRLIHVPFVVAGPAGWSGGPIRSLAELPRFVAEAAGIDSHPFRDEDLPAGAAVAQFDPPVDPTDPRTALAVQRWGLGEEAMRRLTTPLTTATDGRYKLLLRGGEEELYDLASDPLELNPQHPPEDLPGLEILRTAVRHEASRIEAPQAASPRTASPKELQEIEERMRLLGYM